MNREEELKEQLRALTEEYRAKTQSLVDELTAIEALKPRAPFVIFLDNGADLGKVLRETLQGGLNASFDSGEVMGPCGDPNCPVCKGGTVQ